MTEESLGIMTTTNNMALFVVLALFTCLSQSLSVPWCPMQCSCYDDYGTVDCSHQGISVIPDFMNTTRRLIMDHNNITNIPREAFSKAPNLLILSLASNELQLFETRDVITLVLLQELILRDNSISNFTVREDISLPGLYSLDLSLNQLRDAPRYLSHFAPNLVRLNLSFNYIAINPLHSSYAHLKYLQELDLSGNELHLIEPRTLAPLCHLPNFDTLFLADTGLLDIEPPSFACLRNLTHLSLAQQTFVSESVLNESLQQMAANGSRLVKLSLRETSLSGLPLAMLSRFDELRELELSHTDMMTVDPLLFEKLSKLEIIDLQDNDLEFVDNISCLTNLRSLSLQHNSIKYITLNGMVNLEVVHLQHNLLTKIPQHWLTDTIGLIFVNLSYNRIHNIHQQAFVNVSILKLDLSHNRLAALYGVGSLRTNILTVSYNMLLSVSNKTFDSTAAVIQELDMSYNNLSRFPHQDYAHFDSLHSLNLAHNNLGVFIGSSDAQNFFRQLDRLQNLDLTANSISTINYIVMRQLRHLATLNLRANDIRLLEELHLDEVGISFAKIVLSMNRIETMNVNLLQQCRSLEEVDLSDNPFACNCSAIPLLLWLNTTIVDVLYFDDGRNYRCASPIEMRGHQLAAVSHELFSTCILRSSTLINKLTVVCVVVVALLLATVIVALVACYGRICQKLKDIQYRWQIRYREVSGVEIANDIPVSGVEIANDISV